MSSLHQILVAVTIALPFLLVRTIYTGLNAINMDTSGSTGHTTKFNPISGDWVLYLVLGLFMEIAVVAVYAMAGIWNYVRSWKGFEEQRSLELTDWTALVALCRHSYQQSRHSNR
jgi:hypothetical protein